MNIKKLFKSADLHIRDAQIEMIEAVKTALVDGAKLIIEAPTATGKSFAYLLGALWANKLCQNKGKDKLNIIISTAAVALQEQLIFKDLPFVQKLLSKNADQNFSYRLVKGRSRYLCPKKLHALSSDNEALNQEVQKLDQNFSKDWDGDFDNLEKPVTQILAKAIYNSSSSCLFSRCSYYQYCPFFVARQGLRRADIIVTNHSLLLAHLDLGDGAILPKFEKSIYIIDECHHLPDRALKAFSGGTSLLSSQSWINDVDKLLNALPSELFDHNLRQNWQLVRQGLVQALTRMQQYIDVLYRSAKKTEKIWRIKSLTEKVLDLAVEIKKSASFYVIQCEVLKKALEGFAEKSKIYNSDSLEQQFTQLGFLLERSQNLQKVWSLMANVSISPPIAKWVIPHDQTDKEQDQRDLLIQAKQDYDIHASPIEAASLLKRIFWQNIVNGVVLCSATVRSLGKFNRFLNATGLRDDANTLLLPSSLLYHNSTLEIANMQYSPTHQEMHIKETINLLNNHYLKDLSEGAMVLFTSIYAMETVYAGLLPNLKRITLIQGDRSKQAMIKLHKKRVDELKPSIIFGVDSFAEGVDLPGDYLTKLIIHKLPFSVPTNPIDKTRAEWLLSIKRKPFMDISLPQSSLKLTQMVGRLVRKESDVGEVIILDNRLKTKFYGKVLLGSLPLFSRK